MARVLHKPKGGMAIANANKMPNSGFRSPYFYIGYLCQKYSETKKMIFCKTPPLSIFKNLGSHIVFFKKFFLKIRYHTGPFIEIGTIFCHRSPVASSPTTRQESRSSNYSQFWPGLALIRQSLYLRP